jgi:bifunctional DNA-binding transcriptional regulator/antitoxin component of YhaV-PrlF toxin-antitoxin module
LPHCTSQTNGLHFSKIRRILNFSMNTSRYIKSFSKGQITIPKEFRDVFGIGDEFWLKISIEDGKLIAEPVENKETKWDYAQKLLGIKGEWFSEEEYTNLRKSVAKRVNQSPL